MEVRPFSGHRHRRGKASPQGVPGRSTGPGKDTAGRSECGSGRTGRLTASACQSVDRCLSSGRPETGLDPLTVGVENLRLAEPARASSSARRAETRIVGVRQPPRQNRSAGPVDDHHQIEEAARDRNVGHVGRPHVVRPFRPRSDCAAVKVSGVSGRADLQPRPGAWAGAVSQPFHQPTNRKLVVVKSTNHFMAAFGPIAKKVIYVDADGPLSRDYRRIPLHRGPAPDLAAGCRDPRRG